MNDIDVQNHGSLFLLCPNTQQASDWLMEHCNSDEAQWWGGPLPSLVVEPRYVEAIVQGAREEGLVVA